MFHFRSLILSLALSCAIHFVVFFFFSYCSLFHGAVGVGGRGRLNVMLRPGFIEVHSTDGDSLSSIGKTHGAVVLDSKSFSVSSSDSEIVASTSEEAQSPYKLARYFSADDVTFVPLALSDPFLEGDDYVEYPVSGTVVLDLWISEKGDVVYTEIVRSDLPERLVLPVERAFQRIRFVPGTLNGKQVGVVVQIEVDYENFLSAKQ